MQESEGVLCMRVSFRIALAGQVIGVSALYEQTRTFCKNYLTDYPCSASRATAHVPRLGHKKRWRW